MESFVGIDYSTRKVSLARIASVRYSTYVKTFVAPKRLTGIEATMRMMEEFTTWCTDAMVLESAVFIESPIMGRALNVQTAVNMGIAAGALMQASITYGAASVDFVSPSFWKKSVTGNGGYDKAEVAEWLQKHHREYYDMCSNQDEIDSMCLALLSRQTSVAADG